MKKVLAELNMPEGMGVIVRTAGVGRSTEEMVQYGSEVFVANWSGYNQTLKNNKVLIIDGIQDKMVDSITVGIEPNSMVLDHNNILWVLCSGGYENAVIPSLWKIDVATHEVIDMLINALHLNIQPDDLDPDTPLFGSGLGLDSVDAVMIVVELESKYNFSISEEEGMHAMRTVNSIIDLVIRKKNNNA